MPLVTSGNWRERFTHFATHKTSVAAMAAAGGAVVGYAGIVPLVGLFGFGPTGVVAGSVAAALQTPVTVAGSWFACLQSVGAVGALSGPATGAFVAGGAAVGGVVGAVATNSEDAIQACKDAPHVVKSFGRKVVDDVSNSDFVHRTKTVYGQFKTAPVIKNLWSKL